MSRRILVRSELHEFDTAPGIGWILGECRVHERYREWKVFIGPLRDRWLDNQRLQWPLCGRPVRWGAADDERLLWTVPCGPVRRGRADDQLVHKLVPFRLLPRSVRAERV